VNLYNYKEGSELSTELTSLYSIVVNGNVLHERCFESGYSETGKVNEQVKEFEE